MLLNPSDLVNLIRAHHGVLRLQFLLIELVVIEVAIMLLGVPVLVAK